MIYSHEQPGVPALARFVIRVVRRVVLATVTALTLACAGDASTGLPGRARNTQELETRLEILRRQRQVPGMSAAIAQGDRIVWSHGFGVADLETGSAATATTSFHAASLTKLFAAVIIMRLVERDMLDLDTPVSTYGVSIANADAIRVRHLLSMTSDNPPGESFRYDGDRFDLLRSVIFTASGRSFAQLVVDEIIQPLGLAHTAPNVANPTAFAWTGIDPTEFTANLAKPYAVDRGRIVPSQYPAGFGPAAGIISSAVDLAKLSMALDAGQLVSAESREAMFTPAMTSGGVPLPYAFGAFSQRYEGVRVIWSYGYWTGNSSLLIKVPERGLTFVLMANSDQLSAPYPLGAGRLLESPFAREFLYGFVFADGVLGEKP